MDVDWSVQYTIWLLEHCGCKSICILWVPYIYLSIYMVSSEHILLNGKVVFFSKYLLPCPILWDPVLPPLPISQWELGTLSPLQEAHSILQDGAQWDCCGVEQHKANGTPKSPMQNLKPGLFQSYPFLTGNSCLYLHISFASCSNF